MRNNPRSSRPADVGVPSLAPRWDVARLSRTAWSLIGLWLALPTQASSAQTYVQVAELDPNNPIGPRITSTVTQSKLSGRTLFGWIGDKVTYIWAPSNQSSPTVYQFASDAAWNRVLVGQKDIYIHQ